MSVFPFHAKRSTQDLAIARGTKGVLYLCAVALAVAFSGSTTKQKKRATKEKSTPKGHLRSRHHKTELPKESHL